MEYIKIDPIDEILKAIGIVHGKSYEASLRYLIYRYLDERKKREDFNGLGIA